VSTLRAILDGEHGAVRDLVRANLTEHADLLSGAAELPRAAYRERVLAVLREMAASGQTGLGFPREYGGRDDPGANVAAFETLAYGDLSVLVKVGVQFGLFGGAVLQLGTKSHHDTYLADVVAARLLGCFAMTESGHGSDVQRLETTATYDTATGEFVVDTPTDLARKDYIGNAARDGRLAVVFAQLVVGGESRGVHALLVPIRDERDAVLPGVRIDDCGPKLGLNGVDNGRLWFDHVRVPRANLLDRYAVVTEDGRYFSDVENPDRRFFTMLGTLVQGRVCVAGAAINAAKVALAIAVDYGLRRRQFGPPGGVGESLLLDYGMHQRRLFPLLARTYALHFAQDRLREGFAGVFTADATERDRRALESRAAATKALGTWHATETIQLCREACGGAGYLTVNRFAALKADTDVFTTFEGDNTVLLQLVAKGLLTEYGDEFGNLDTAGMVRYLASTAVETVIEKTNGRVLWNRLRSVVPGLDGEPAEGVLDSDYHLAMLAGREEHMLAGVARRLKAGIDGGGDAAVVFSACQPHLIGAARAHAERLVLSAFLGRLAELDESPEHDALQLVCRLYALSCIEADRGWFLEHGRLGAARSKAITAQVDALCRDVRPLAGELVEAFGIPPEVRRTEMPA